MNCPSFQRERDREQETVSVSNALDFLPHKNVLRGDSAFSCYLLLDAHPTAIFPFLTCDPAVTLAFY